MYGLQANISELAFLGYLGCVIFFYTVEASSIWYCVGVRIVEVTQNLKKYHTKSLDESNIANILYELNKLKLFVYYKLNHFFFQLYTYSRKIYIPIHQ